MNRDIDAINEAAEKYANDNYEIVRNVHEYNNDNDLTNGFIDGALSDAAKEYWYEQFQSSQKQNDAGVWVDVLRSVTHLGKFIELWHERNPVHENNADDGKDMFWATAELVAKEYCIELLKRGFPNETPSKQLSIQDGWIDVKDRLPDNNDNVLTFADKIGEQIEVAFYNDTDKEWQGLSEFWTKLITHWQPLPNPPAKQH